MSQSEITVSVILLAYNHAPFVSEAVESVLAQTCDFNYELIIGEDHSTDSTLEIVEKLHARNEQIIKLIRTGKNSGAVQNELNCLANARGKYIAFLEGDDYWTDPFKLQRQVDFLEANPDYGMVHGDVNHLQQETGKLIRAYNRSNEIGIPEGDIFEALMVPSHWIKTMTVLVRYDLLKNLYLEDQEIMNSSWRMFDISIWLMIAKHSKVHYFDQVFATYRLLPESMSRSKNPLKIYEFHQRIREIYEYFSDRYPDTGINRKWLEVYFSRTGLVDAFNLNNRQIAAKAFDFLKKSGSKITLKEKILFYGTRHSWVNKLIRFLSDR